MSRLLVMLAMIGASSALSGCAFKKKTDPLEGVNRGIYAINKTVDALYIKPIAKAATKFLPNVVLAGVDNFFDNLGHLPTIANDIFQFKFKEARVAAARFIINSTLGVGGVFDLASRAKLEKHVTDFGQTLAFYGYKESIYIVLPLVGPSTVRDGIGRGVNMGLSVWPYIASERFAWTLYGVYVVDMRARHLKNDEVLKEAAVDEYILVRDAYLQNRRYRFGLESESLDETEEGWDPIEGGVSTDTSKENKDKEDEDKEGETQQNKDLDQKAEATESKKTEADKEKTLEDKDLENKLNRTSETLEANQEKSDPSQEMPEGAADIKGTSTLPSEKRILRPDDIQNNR